MRSSTSNPSHVLWVVVQLVIVRGLIALKFLLSARLLGPELVGLVGIALLSLAIVESLSDTGLPQAIVQRRSEIDENEGGAVWTLMLGRGVLLSIVLVGLSGAIASFFGVVGSAGLVSLAAVVPLVRNAFNPGVYLVQRERDFRALAGYEALAALVDLFVTMALLRIGMGAPSILLGTIAGDGTKLIQTWTRFRSTIRPNLCWDQLKGLTQFGRWIWGSSFMTLVLNQLDKLLVARLLGPTEFGLYQVASRVAQLILADVVTAAGQYLYPTFSQRHREDAGRVAQYLQAVLRYVFICVAGAALLLIIFAPDVIKVVLGAQWLPAVGVLRALACAMLLGAIIAVLVPYCRAIGRPDIVTKATVIQLFVLIPTATVLLSRFGAVGMAVAATVAGFAAVVYLLAMVRGVKVSSSPSVPVLITSAVYASAGMTALSREDDRLREVLRSIDHWSRTAGVTQIVVCEGSGFDFEPHLTAFRIQAPTVEFESLSFSNDEEGVRACGKGFGEGQIVGYALRASLILAGCDAFAKCTGKLWVTNYRGCLAGFNGHLSADFNGKLTPRFIDTRFYIASKRFYGDFLCSAHLEVSDRDGYYLEHAFRDALAGRKLSEFAMCPTPRISGMSGSMGRFYTTNELKARLRDLRSRLIQVFCL
jgi:O-antigen/teichoic acid export membrane protein